ncbi:hypothetical protein [Natrinema sp. SYSU A 869]|uniref:hypothetical protein n=1 Tax=Natrinema sp. SYSU A 869 TaxID=2871694 RepID=UPI001CA3FE54|nr:hypothetical protein [Natrinema sp. SYSU A 869]
MERRSFLGMISSGVALSVAGCTGSGDSGSSDGGNCHEETVVDEFDTYSAGESITWRFDLEEGAELEMKAVQSGEEARPKLEVKDPNGNTIAEVGPSENIRRTITADTSGNYYVEFVNEAMINSGQWDITIESRTAGC